MIHARIENPPEYLELEAEKLAKSFFAQFGDDEIVPDDAYWEYFKKYGSEELKQYMFEVSETYEQAEKEGVLV